eukprot:CAMPEP_0118925072 /NCGR_PEP_ID=MMETSP1169-20130426/2996_1 /TAXON_ID=36882 /ORGANISM="Pyramimonas obovata, Strain CCMP722" /LENGTH=1012 /DNA_ID=CAMNT_0006866271 /DNA_START=199 /DNA_END=3237 /DNA_ORIENTATION=-
MSSADVKIDEDLHSRQLAVYGRETFRRLVGADVLIVGLRGLGVECAKNIVLAGVKGLTIQDTGLVELKDLGAQFYLKEDDVGKNRAEACAARLQELNTAVNVTVHNEPITEEFLPKFQAVLFTETKVSEAIKWNDFCHSHNPPIPFIRADVRGVFGSVFCDFGPSFTVTDLDGEEPHKAIIASISNENPAFVTCVDDERLEFDDGEMVSFSEIKGMDGLNKYGPVKVKNVKVHSFHVEVDTSSMGTYERGGIAVQVKMPVEKKYKTLRESIAEPGEFLLSDFSKFDRPPKLHICFQALDKFQEEEGHLPRPGDAGDAAKLLALVKAVNAASKEPVEEIEESLVTMLAYGASGELSPMAAMFGGLVGQELVKACTGKFQPLNQYFYFDSAESLPKEFPLAAAEYQPVGSRYDSQIAVFGQTLQAKIAKLKVFLVGAGALGCELIKNFALMGIACDGGSVTLTDDDVIEKSNLSRQFLFRDWDLKQPKSTAAAKAALAINPALAVQAQCNRVSPDTEMVFDDDFWGNLDVVVNALDNVNARLYVDSRCVYFCKPLLESGTLGTKCNTQMVIPALTENYGASRDPPEKQAPMCTLHSFPFIIDHCLTWARSEFEGSLEKTPSEGNKYLTNPEAFIAEVKKTGDATAKEAVERVLDVLVETRCLTYEACVEWARKYFQEYFHNRIAQLVFTFPEDVRTSQGALFWSAPKRFPKVLNFDTSDPVHLQFIRAAANLKAEVHGLAKPGVSDAELAAMISAIKIEPFVPKTGVTIETDPKADKKAPTASADDETLIAGLVDRLVGGAGQLVGSYKLAPVEFEKDDDTNFHMDFISACANLRARNYDIPEVDKLQAKLIAGRIIPAIATTTAMSTGLVCLEMYKLLQDAPMEAYRNTFANLALPLFAMAEPISSKKITYNDLEWTLWDRWIMEGDLTVQELLNWFEERKLTAYSVSCGQSLIYNNFFAKHKERLGRKLSELVVEIAKLEIPAKRRHFDIVVAVEDEEGEDLDVPLVSIRFR